MNGETKALKKLEFSRQYVYQLRFNKPYPQVNKAGLPKDFEDTFISAPGRNSYELALQVLEDIRANYPSSNGWVCAEGHEGVYQDDRGLWHAFQHHARYIPKKSWCSDLPPRLE